MNSETNEIYRSVIEAEKKREKDLREEKIIFSALIGIEVIITMIPFTKPVMPAWSWLIWAFIAFFTTGLILWNWIIEGDSDVSKASLTKAVKVMAVVALIAVASSIILDPSVQGKKAVRASAPNNVKAVH